MALGIFTDRFSSRRAARSARRWTLAALALSSTSCIPAISETTPLAVASETPVAIVAANTAPVAATAAPAPALPASAPATFSGAFRPRTALDGLRSLDCLAQAIYYEAASESEAGQRAVAQVVLNRVRHPAWPNSVCGVVYQGPMRPGGGCQFTFTCDGALSVRPGGAAWARARAIAAEALAGRTFAPAGLSTHYHTHAVAPTWAPRLDRTIVIGAHNFYALPGAAGRASAFAAAYSGSEPLPRPSMRLRSRGPAPAGLAALVPAGGGFDPLGPVTDGGSDIASDPTRGASRLPESTIREEYRGSGQWRSDAPAAITGR